MSTSSRNRLWLFSGLALIVLLSIYLIQTGPSAADPALTDATPAAPNGPRAVSDVEHHSTDPAVARLEAEDGEARKAVGRATTPEGLPVAGADVCVGQSRETLSKEVVSSTDTRGNFSLQIPPHWNSVYATVSTGSGRRGSKSSPISMGPNDSTVDLGTIVVQRHTDVTLSWQLKDDAGKLLQEHGIALTVVAREHKERSVFGPQPATQELCEVDPTLPVGTTTVDVQMEDPVDIGWVVKQKHRNQLEFFTDPIPKDVGTYESRCTVDNRMMLLGNVVDKQGAPVSFVKLFVWARHGIQKINVFDISTDADGRFFDIVPPGASGRIGPFIGPPPTEAEKLRPPLPPTSWVAGAPVTVIADTSFNLFVEVRDAEGHPVTDYSIASVLNSTRDEDGRISDRALMHTPSGAFHSRLGTLEPGTRLFVQVPGEGEHIHLVQKHVTPSADPYRITLGPTSLGSVTVKLRVAPDRKPPGRGLLVKLKDDIDDSINEWDYWLNMSMDKARAGWTAELIHSGTYEFVVLVNGSRLVASGNVTVEAGKESTIEVVL